MRKVNRCNMFLEERPDASVMGGNLHSGKLSPLGQSFIESLFFNESMGVAEIESR